MAKGPVFAWTPGSLRVAIQAAMKGYGKEIADLLEEPTRSWMPEHRPNFVVTNPQRDGDDLTAIAGVDPVGSTWQAEVPFRRGENEPPGSVIYLWVTRGTKVHRISPVEAPFLHFWHKYVPSTSPSDWKSASPSNTHSQEMKRLSVVHPGIEPRRFEERAAEEKGPGFAEAIQDAITKHVSAGNLFAPPTQGGRVNLANIGAAERRPNRRRRS